VPWPWLFVLAMAICAWPWLFVPCRGYLSLLAKSIKIGLLVSFFELKQSLCCSIPIHLKQVKAYSLIPKYLRFIKNKVLSYVKTTILVEYLLKRKNYYL
jgi:hypothetical protein